MSKSLKTTPQALAGITIIDMSRFLPASYCSMMLADFGANVIRVEQPREIEKQNKIFGRDGLTTEELQAFKDQEILARNKRSVSLNLRSAPAKAALNRLLSSADVVIHDYRQKNAEAMGLAFSELQERYPRLVCAAISLCGQSGPYQSLAGHDPIALALSGALSRFPSDNAEFHIPGMPVGDLTTGLQATIGILMALRARDVTGRGQLVDIAMSDCALSLMSSVMQRYLMDAKAPPLAWTGANIGLWKTQDGKTLCTTDLEPAYWEKFCKAVARDDLLPLQFDEENAAYRDAELTTLFATRTRADWFQFLQGVDTQVAPAYTLEEALQDPHARARGTVVDIANAAGDTVTHIGPGIKLSETPGEIRSLGHLPGTDTNDVLRECGFSDEEIAALKPFTV